MITKIRIQGYRSLRDVTVELDPLTVLVGKNGSGKSNFVEALRTLARLTSVGLTTQDLNDDFFNMAWRGPKPGAPGWVEQEDRVRYEVWGNDRDSQTPWRYILELVLGERRDGTSFAGDVAVDCEELWCPDPSTNPLFVRQNDKVEVQASGMTPALSPTMSALPSMAGTGVLAAVRGDLAEMVFHDIDPRRVEWPVKPNGRRLEPDGTNAAAVVYRLPGDRLNSLSADLVLFAEQFDRVVSAPIRDGRLVLGYYRKSSSGDGMLWPPYTVSDGTLRATGMLAALYQDTLPRLVGFEEPENGLHPGAMFAFLEIAAAASRRCTVLITTHSSELITHVPTKSIRVVEWEDGETKIGPLDPEQVEVIREELFTAGELVRVDGGLRRDRGLERTDA